MPTAKKCAECGNKAFLTIIDYDLHIKSKHNGRTYIGDVFKCEYCTNFFATCDELDTHIESEHS